MHTLYLHDKHLKINIFFIVCQTILILYYKKQAKSEV